MIEVPAFRVFTKGYITSQTALANSFLLQLKGRPAWTPYRSQSRWQQAVVDDIFKTYKEKGSSRQRYHAGNIAIPID
jgi:hypothetical protein